MKYDPLPLIGYGLCIAEDRSIRRTVQFQRDVRLPDPTQGLIDEIDRLDLLWPTLSSRPLAFSHVVAISKNGTNKRRNHIKMNIITNKIIDAKSL